jgi:hypothetical protein
MKKFAIHISLLLLILIVLDRICGAVLENLFYKQTHGDEFVSIELLEHSKADVLLLGSSRASHHFISDSIEQQTGMTVYNGGRDNMGIHYINAVVPEILNRYTPKYIVIDLIPNNFCKGSQDVQGYFDIQSSALLPFANKHQPFYNCVQQYNSLEVYKAKYIKCYAYNSLIGSMIQNTFTKIGHTQIKGYEPLATGIDTTVYKKPFSNEFNLQPSLDSTSFQLFEQTIQACQAKGVKVIVCFSPFYFERPIRQNVQAFFQRLSTAYQFPILDYCTDSNYMHHSALFYDELHLNNHGAAMLSKSVGQYIK